ncbi:MAG: alpha-1,2-fucosyltransferase [Bacilli bacterium]
MKVIKLKGGLGNQMFQYAFAKALQKRTRDVVKIDDSYYKVLVGDNIRKVRIRRFNLSIPFASREDVRSLCKVPHESNPLSFIYKSGLILEKIINRSYYFERNRMFVDFDKLTKYKYFDGYWQSWRYVDSVRDELEKDFLIPKNIDLRTQMMIERVASQNSVFIGVRKGDYGNNTKRFGCFDQEYYDKAMKIIADKIDNPIFYVFSNDIQWVKENMEFQKWNVVFREDYVDDFDELMIMANCKHAIIINSTYHWWGARLKETKDKMVIAPKKWFFDTDKIDILPPNWIKI